MPEREGGGGEGRRKGRRGKEERGESERKGEGREERERGARVRTGCVNGELMLPYKGSHMHVQNVILLVPSSDGSRTSKPLVPQLCPLSDLWLNIQLFSNLFNFLQTRQ